MDLAITHKETQERYVVSIADNETVLSLKAKVAADVFDGRYHVGRLAFTLPGGEVLLGDDDTALKDCCLQRGDEVDVTTTGTAKDRDASVYLLQQALQLPNKKDTLTYDGEKLNAGELIARAAALDPLHITAQAANLAFQLSTDFKGSKSVSISANTRQIREALFKDVIARYPGCSFGYHNLAGLLQPKGTTTLHDKTEVSRVDLYQKVLQINPGFAAAYFHLYDIMADDATVQIAGDLLSKDDVLQRGEQGKDTWEYGC